MVLELVDDGDLIILIRKLLFLRGVGTVCISKVKGCGPWIVMAIFVLMKLLTWDGVGSGLRSLMLPVVQVLHRFFIAISRALVNCDDSPGLAPHPLV